MRKTNPKIHFFEICLICDQNTRFLGESIYRKYGDSVRILFDYVTFKFVRTLRTGYNTYNYCSFMVENSITILYALEEYNLGRRGGNTRVCSNTTLLQT